MSNQKFTKALKRIPQAIPPIWCMRQAGRYHDHYQQLKKKYTFEQLCKTPELAAEVAMGPIEDFDFDVAILFSDILFPLEALGMDLKYNPGPILSPLLSDFPLEKMKSLDEASEFLNFQAQAVEATRERLPKDKSLIGFIGGPWTLFTYAIEGSHKGHLTKAKLNLELFESFSQSLIPLLEKNIEMQLACGAEIVMIFDTAAGEISSKCFQQYIAPQLKKLVQRNPGKIGYYSKGTLPEHYHAIANEPWAGFGFDHRWDLTQLPSSLKKGFVQGNFDQTLLFTEPDNFKSTLLEYLRPLGELNAEQKAGWVCGLGHGILPQTPEENVRTFVNLTREFFDAK